MLQKILEINGIPSKPVVNKTSSTNAAAWIKNSCNSERSNTLKKYRHTYITTEIQLCTKDYRDMAHLKKHMKYM